MKRISSGSLFITKRVFPVLWFGVLALVAIQALMTGAFAKQPVLVAVPAVMAIFGFLLMKKIVWDLVDEVYDAGDFLIVRNHSIEDTVPLSDIMNVSASTLLNPPRISLRLVTAGKFGSEIAFAPATVFSLNPFARNKVAEDLIVRVDQARMLRAR